MIKELSSCNKLLFLNLHIFASRYRPLIFQTMISIGSNSVSLEIKGLLHQVAMIWGLENLSL